jgi:hypothetical protein
MCKAQPQLVFHADANVYADSNANADADAYAKSRQPAIHALGLGTRPHVERTLQRLVKTLDNPIKFSHAWTWFVCLTSFRYRDPELSAAMMRFGWKVVSSASTCDWSTVLRVYVELAGPMLTGILLQAKGMCGTRSFAEHLLPYKTNQNTGIQRIMK